MTRARLLLAALVDVAVIVLDLLSRAAGVRG